MLHVYQVCHGVGISCCVKMWVVLHQAWSESQWTVLLGYLKQMLAVIKHVADDNFQQVSTQARCACNVVHLPQREIPNFLVKLRPGPQTTQSWTPLNIRFTESYYSSVNMICESSRLKKSSSDWLKSGNTVIQHVWVKNVVLAFPCCAIVVQKH